MKDITSRYTDLLKSALCASLYDESAWQLVQGPMRQHNRSLSQTASYRIKHKIIRRLAQSGLALVRTKKFHAQVRDVGDDWPLFGYTMTGRKRLDALQMCVEAVLRDQVPGDFIETGVWRGGSVIFMRALLELYDVKDRIVWCADSFEGLPPPNETDRAILADSDLSDREYLAVSLEQVQENFRRFGLLDDQVKFLKGWFSQTLPSAPIDRLAILRLDGDLYESTADALHALYDKVSIGGFVIVDDYDAWPTCKKAINDFREKRGISTPIEWIDKYAIYWRIGR